MPRKLSEINVDWISLVKAGANGKTVILKGKENPVFDKEIALVKSDIEGVVYGIVYAPGEVDSQGDFAEAGEIKKAAYGFMKGLGARNVDANHDSSKRPAYVAESWIVKQGDPVFPDEKEGSWAVAIQLEDQGLITAVQKGEIRGLSMAGQATAEDVDEPGDDDPAGDSELKKFAKWIGEFFAKQDKQDKHKDEDMSDVTKGLKEGLEKGFDGIRKDLAGLQKDGKGLETRIAALESKLAKSGQDEAPGDLGDADGIV